MNTKKQYPNDKLQKSSILFLQLGLVLALFIVYGLLEFETEKKPLVITSYDPMKPDIIIESVPTYIVKIPKKIKPKKIQKKAPVDIVITKPDEFPDIEDILKPEVPEDMPNINDQINELPGGDVDNIDDSDEPVIFIKLEEAPIFPGCEGLNIEESKKCFVKGISKFVNRKFNPDIAEGLNISGKQRIWVEFMIDKTGVVTNIKARSPYKNLEKEALRVVQKLPQMTPGKQRKRPVSVKYTLPIIFQVY